VPYKIIKVDWADCTHYDDAALDPEEIAKEQLIQMQDVGYLVTENKIWIALAQEMIPDQNRFRHITWIPKVNIISKTVLSPKHR
jgi:hypothetical protein